MEHNYDDDGRHIIPIEAKLTAERERQARFRKEIEDTRKRLGLHTPLFARHFAAERIEPITEEMLDDEWSCEQPQYACTAVLETLRGRTLRSRYNSMRIAS